MKAKKVSTTLARRESVSTLYRAVRAVLEQARASAYRTANVAMVRAYWQVGCLIVEPLCANMGETLTSSSLV